MNQPNMPTIMVTIGSFAPDGAKHFESYVAGVLPLLEKAGAKVRERLRGLEALVGLDFPDLVAVLEFPSDAAMHSFLNSEEYRALIHHREKAFKYIRTFSCEAM